MMQDKRTPGILIVTPEDAAFISEEKTRTAA
jgi:hypothetical protein